MENKVDNQLVTISGPDAGRTFVLLKGRTTIGSAEPNDVVLDDPDVSGFHGEFRIGDSDFYFTDFNSEKGTFVNGARIEKEASVFAGDAIKIGSTETVFVPRNAIMVKQGPRPKKIEASPKMAATYNKKKMVAEKQKYNPRRKKWLTAASVLLFLMVVGLKVTFRDNRYGDGQPTDPSQVQANGGSDSPNSTEENSAQREQEQDTGKKTGETNGGLNTSTSNVTIQPPAEAEHNQLDGIENDYVSVANKFADHQLWEEALENYRWVYEKKPDYPGLSVDVAKMQFEMLNQTAFQQGKALIQKEHYDQAIATLKDIPENSYYYSKAVQEIKNVEKNDDQTAKVSP